MKCDRLRRSVDGRVGRERSLYGREDRLKRAEHIAVFIMIKRQRHHGGPDKVPQSFIGNIPFIQENEIKVLYNNPRSEYFEN
jgi:hypothetical protein